MSVIFQNKQINIKNIKTSSFQNQITVLQLHDAETRFCSHCEHTSYNTIQNKILCTFVFKYNILEFF